MLALLLVGPTSVGPTFRSGAGDDRSGAIDDQQPPRPLTNEQGLPGLTGTPQGSAILRIEEARAPTPQDLALLIESARSAQPHIQQAAIQALGRLERRDVVTDLLPYLRTGPNRAEAAQAIGQAMRGETLPLDPNDTQLDGVQQALLGAATLPDGPMGAVAVTLGRLPYNSAAQVAKANTFMRQILELSPQVGRNAAVGARMSACRGLELLARLQSKLFAIPKETLVALRRVATADEPTVKRVEDMFLRMQALQALVSAGGVDADTLRREIGDALHPTFRRLSMVALGGGASPVLGDDRLDYLRQGMIDRDYTVRYEALRGYVRHHAKAEGCQPVMDLLLDPNEHVVLLAIDLLATCADDENVVNRLVGEARTPPNTGSWRRESHALVSLARRAPDWLEPPLLSHSRHTVWQVRMYAARAASIANALPTLELLALDAHDNVRDAAIGALRRLKGSEAEPYLLAALGRNDYQLLRTTAREMAGLPATPALTGALVEALTRVTAQRKDTSRDTRLAILERLRELGSARDFERVEPLLRDFDPKVAEAAAATLGAWTGSTYAIDPVLLAPDLLPSAAELAIVTNQCAFVDMAGGKRFGIKLDALRAPMMATRFLRLVNRNYFDGLTFHRVVPNFIVQGGSPGANEYAGDAQYVKDEISSRTHARGTVGLSTRGRDTGDAQFFINLVANPRLDFEYTVFGHVVEVTMPIDEIMEGDRIVNITFRRMPSLCR
ncbi:MAG: peptidylprolyl isomerase [Vicinamibacterales bacterium]